MKIVNLHILIFSLTFSCTQESPENVSKESANSTLVEGDQHNANQSLIADTEFLETNAGSASKPSSPLSSKSFVEKKTYVDDLKIKPDQRNKALPLVDSIDAPKSSDARMVTNLYKDGSLQVSYGLDKGKKNGLYTAWYENGGLKKKGWMKDDKWHGTYKEWWTKGALRVKGAYFEGMQNGEWRFFDTDGNALPTLYFDMGQEVTRDLKKLRPD